MKLVLVDEKYINLDQVVAVQKDGFRMADGSHIHVNNSNLENIIKQLEVILIKIEDEKK